MLSSSNKGYETLQVKPGPRRFTPVILVVWRLMQQDCKFGALLGYTVRACLKKLNCEGWRDVSVIKIIDCSSRGSEFDS